MLNLIHRIYRRDNVTLDIINALKIKLTSVENKINDVYKQMFLDYSTWYLDLKEKEMSINKKPDDIDKRRAYVKTRLLGTGTATKEMLESTVNSINGVEAEIILEGMIVVINFLKVADNKYLGLAKKSVENMIPYHLDLELRYDHVNWGEIKGVNWQRVQPYTWGSVSQSVSGTILGGLDDDFN